MATNSCSPTRTYLHSTGCEPVSILDRFTEADHAVARDEQARPGAWFQEKDYPRGDGRPLSQHETNLLIVSELSRRLEPHDAALLQTHIERQQVGLDEQQHGALAIYREATAQRGGIHDDELVRLLAFGVWGDRDRQWRRRDTARALGRTEQHPIEVYQRVYGFEILWVSSISRTQLTIGATREGRVILVTRDHEDCPGFVDESRMLLDREAVVLDMLDELDEKLSG